MKVALYENKIWLSQMKIWVKSNECMNGMWDNFIEQGRTGTGSTWVKVGLKSWYENNVWMKGLNEKLF